MMAGTAGARMDGLSGFRRRRRLHRAAGQCRDRMEAPRKHATERVAPALASLRDRGYLIEAKLPSSSGPGRRPLTAKTGVRGPLGSANDSNKLSLQAQGGVP